MMENSKQACHPERSEGARKQAWASIVRFFASLRMTFC